MPKKLDRIPKYGLHKATGQARVVLDGRSHYLGKYGTEESRREYERAVGEWLTSRRVVSLGEDCPWPPTALKDPRNRHNGRLTIVELIAAYLRQVREYYVKDGKPTKEQANVPLAMRPLHRLYGRSPAAQFGPLSLKTVRQAMIDAGWSRSYVNDQTGRIKRMFKWAVENEMVPASVSHGLRAVSGLRRGRSGARETEPVRPVPSDRVDAIRPYVSRQVWAMIQLQQLTGMRPGEAVIIRGCDVDMSGELWEYRPCSHKGQHHDRERIIPLGPRSQGVIRGFLKSDVQAPLFSPADAEAERRAAVHANRKTPLSCGNRPGSHRRPQPSRKPRDRYSVDSYRRAIQRACDTAFSPPDGLGVEGLKQWRKEHRWHPHQLRHSSGTKIRKELGLEAAQVWLGHSRADVTQIYAERNLELARTIAAKFG